MGNNKFLKNTSWIIMGHIAKLFVSFLVSILTTRYLGPSQYGLITYIQSYITFFTAIIGLGLNGVIIYEFVKYPEDDGNIIGTAITLRLAVGLISCAAFLPFVYIVEKADSSTMMIAVLQSIQLPFLCLDTIQYWYQSRLQSKYAVIAQFLSHLVTAVFKIYLLATKKSVEWFAIALSLDVIILGLFYVAFYLKHQAHKLRWSSLIAKRLLKSCWPFILSSLMIVIYGQTDKVMIKFLTGSESDVGLYSVAVAICTMIGFIPNAILESARPIVLKAHERGDEAFTYKFKLMTAGVFWVCILYSVFITIFSKIILNLLYGAEYLPANSCLKIVVWYTAFSYIGSAKSIWLIAEEKNRYVFIFGLMGAVSNILMNLFLIPICSIEGASIATLLTQILVNFIYPIFFKSTRRYTKLAGESIILKGISLKKMIDSIVPNRFKRIR